MKKDFTAYQEIITKVLAVFGLVVMLGVGSFATITVIKYIPTGFRYAASAAVSLSSVFISAEKIVVTVSPTAIDSGKEVGVSFRHESKTDEGSYSLSYPCLSGVEMKAFQDSIKTPVFCNVPFPLTGTNGIMLLPVSTKNRYVDVPITVSFTKNGKTTPTITGSMTVTVTNSSIADSSAYLEDKKLEATQEEVTSLTKEVASTPTPEKKEVMLSLTPKVTAPVSTPNGKPDLMPTIIGIGSVDPITNVFTSSPMVKIGTRAAVRFSVANLGTKESGPWNFTVKVPTFPESTFDSDTQPSLQPGDRIEFILGFDSIYDNGDRTLTVNVDPAQNVREASEENNITKIVLTTTK